MKGISVVVLAAGKGVRLRSRVPKPLVRIAGKPLVQYSLATFQGHPGVGEIILVTSKALMKTMAALITRCGFTKVSVVVLGGKERQDSVKKGLAHVAPGASIVAIHDGARPLVQAQVLTRLITAARSHKAAIVAVPVKATVKKVADGRVLSSLDRRNLWEVQTPQVFEKELLRKAFARHGRALVTDDAMVVEKFGAPVFVVEGSYKNIKVTTPEDVAIAEALLKLKG